MMSHSRAIIALSFMILQQQRERISNKKPKEKEKAFRQKDKVIRQPLSWLPVRIYNLLPQAGQKVKSSESCLPQ